MPETHSSVCSVVQDIVTAVFIVTALKAHGLHGCWSEKLWDGITCIFSDIFSDFPEIILESKKKAGLKVSPCFSVMATLWP